MKASHIVLCGVVLLSAAVLLPAASEAACGVIQKSATASTAQKATKKATTKVKWEVTQLKWKHGKKLVLSEREVACLGGAAYVDAQGKQHYGDPSCTVTQPFCVNP